ncbi:hypothetical protein D9756_003957 [Leucocoprinus leucothites]|uniref:Uncharacterized protein n=1 Tax=Leucocoprinus leucothites TaxID=201217 RepID=A0A8H5G0H8_9AGAR|nr:hypothetical protein D9756_003957 [Leucoagaricus leucothites]
MDQLGLSPPPSKSSLLGVNASVESPGSSVFDLPIQPAASTSTIAIRSPPILLQLASSRTAGNFEEANNLSFVIISGGTGGNAICSAFGNACYVLPVSDDGGSSSEIIRVLGGPSIGDIRSRLVRLIPAAPSSSPLEAIRHFLSYRLPAKCDEKEARDEWRDIVEGRSPLWTGIPNDRKETIRGFLVYFESELLRRAHKNFDFRNGSCTKFLPISPLRHILILAAILPVIVTNHTVTIAAELENGTRLVGQCEISHPVPQGATFEAVSDDPLSPIEGLGERISQKQNVMFEHGAKAHFESLVSPIARLFYINAYGMEIHPAPNPDYLANLDEREVLIYSCGSLWTSIIPCLALRGVAASIARSSKLRAKILLCEYIQPRHPAYTDTEGVNVENDRETERYTAVDYILTITKTLNSSYQAAPYGLGNANTTYPVSAFVTHLVYLEGANVPIDVRHITALGVRCMRIKHEGHDNGEAPRYNPTNVQRAVNEILRGLEC